MSYILDALRKSDQQRQRGVTPTLLAPQATAVEPGRRLPVSYAVLTVVLIGAGVVIGALRPWQTEQATKSPGRNPLESTPRASPVPAQPRLAQQPTQNAPTPGVKPPIPSSAVLSDSAGMERRATAAAKPKVVERALTPPRQALPAAPQQIKKAVPEKPQGIRPVQQQKLLTMAELPLSVRQEMPPLSISVHAYSREPKDRLVGINDRVLHEGADLAPGLRLEEITRDGMILRYRGYRFWRGVR